MRKLLITGVVVCTSCGPISNSIKETFEPNDTVMAAMPKSAPAAIAETTRAHVSVQFSSSSASTTTTRQSTETTPAGQSKTGFLSDAERLNKAAAALKNLPQFAGRELYLYNSMHFYDDGRIMLQLRQPDNPKYVDAYDYRDGKWSEGKPVQLTLRDEEQLNTKSVSLNSIDFAAVAKIKKIYNEKAAEIQGAEPLTVVYMIVWDGKKRWYPRSISGSRERYSIEFNDDGSLQRFKRD